MSTAIALSGHAFSALSPEELLDRMQAYGVTALDWWPHNARGLSLDAYAARCASRGLRVMCVNVPGNYRLGLKGHADDVRTAILRGIETAVTLGAPYVQLYAGVGAGLSADEALWAASEDLRACTPAAASAGIELLIENNLDQRGEDPNAVNPSRRATSLAKLVQSGGNGVVGVTFDPANFHAVAEEPFPYAYEALDSLVKVVHLKDLTRVLPSTLPTDERLLVDSICGPFRVVPLGCGALNLVSLFRALSADSFAGWLVLDPFGDPSDLGRLDAWCRQSLEFVQSHCEG